LGLQHPAKLGPLDLAFPPNKRRLLSGPPHFDDIANLQPSQQVSRRTQIDNTVPGLRSDEQAPLLGIDVLDASR
jgi:hypothetical protein